MNQTNMLNNKKQILPCPTEHLTSQKLGCCGMSHDKQVAVQTQIKLQITVSPKIQSPNLLPSYQSPVNPVPTSHEKFHFPFPNDPEIHFCLVHFQLQTISLDFHLNQPNSNKNKHNDRDVTHSWLLKVI